MYSPIFIIGAERSGTTLLRLILTSHSRVSIPPESRFMMGMYDKYSKINSLDEIDKYIEDLYVFPFFKDWEISKNDLKTGISNLVDINYKAINEVIYNLYAQKEGKEIWGDKNPGYTLEVENILKLFPNAKFIHLIRDGRDIVVSLGETDWGEKEIEDASLKWKTFVTAGNKAKENYPDQVFEMKYEDIVTHSSQQIDKLCEFLDLTPEGKMFEFHKNNKEKQLVPKGHEDFHPNTFKPITKSRVGRWKAHLSIAQVLKAHKVIRKELISNGYDVPNLLGLLKIKASNL